MNTEGNTAREIRELRDGTPLTPPAEIHSPPHRETTERSLETDQETRDEMAQNSILDRKTLELHKRVNAIVHILKQSERDQFYAAFQQISDYRKNANLSTARNYLETFSDLIEIYEQEQESARQRHKEFAKKNTENGQKMLASIDARIAKLKDSVSKSVSESFAQAREEMLSCINEKNHVEVTRYNSNFDDLLSLYEDDLTSAEAPEEVTTSENTAAQPTTKEKIWEWLKS